MSSFAVSMLLRRARFSAHPRRLDAHQIRTSALVSRCDCVDNPFIRRPRYWPAAPLMTRPELPEPPGPLPATELPLPLRPRTSRREHRADLDGCMFGVVWPLPRAVQFPTLARRVVALLSLINI